MILTDNALVMPVKVSQRLDMYFGQRLNWLPMQTGGTRHNLFLANSDNQCWVARVAPNRPLPPGVDPEREAKVLAEISGIRGALRPVLIDPDAGLLLMPYLGKALDSDSITTEIISKIILFINRLHKVTNAPSINYPALFTRYRNHFSRSAPGMAQLVDETEGILNELPDIGLSLVHHDLHCGNWLWDSQLHLIDWEYAGQGNPWLDYAALVRDFGLNLEQLRSFDRLALLNDRALGSGLAKAIQLVDQLENIWQHYVALAQPDEQPTTLSEGEFLCPEPRRCLNN
ncbi:MAG TPA: phosphotransferase [Marinobacterium sp.]|nr:phosphotransferase [Marinobacterium sp.]